MYPKYYQIKQNIEDRILNGELKPDQRVFSEDEFAKFYEVSRITVRKAISELVQDGLLYTIQGKGTYVSPHSSDIDIVSLTSCTQDIKNMGYTVRREVIDTEIKIPETSITKSLRILKDDKVFNLSRVYYADDQPINFTTTNLPIKYFEGIQEYDFKENSLYEVLQIKYGVVPEDSKRSVQAVIAPKHVCELLNIEEGTPVLLFECVAHAYVNGMYKPIEAYTTWYRGDKFKFYIHQKR